ncbi:hypothetical protein QBC43DRAFT_320674 [Cladorrhinum sp. PSN259]|nr:hypothetical protein QBC43DRAFT_320674 [Cladorrhinum sp. PSN259]
MFSGIAVGCILAACGFVLSILNKAGSCSGFSVEVSACLNVGSDGKRRDDVTTWFRWVIIVSGFSTIRTKNFRLSTR